MASLVDLLPPTGGGYVLANASVPAAVLEGVGSSSRSGDLVRVDIALGFGLFAILSIIRLRSSTVTQQEVAYYFVALVMGLVNGMNQDLIVTRKPIQQ